MAIGIFLLSYLEHWDWESSFFSLQKMGLKNTELALKIRMLLRKEEVKGIYGRGCFGKEKKRN